MTTSTSYDAAGELQSRKAADGNSTSYTYDNAGELTKTTDPKGRVTTRDYTGDGQLKSVAVAGSGTEAWTYGPDGNLTGYTDADGHHTTYNYDQYGQLQSTVDPGGLTTQTSYDNTGRLSVTTQPDGSTITTTYYFDGLLKKIDYSAATTPDVNFTYDAAGNRHTMVDGTGTTSYTYDDDERLTSTTNEAGATVTETLDPAGQLSTLVYPGGNTVTYGYDAAGQMTSARDWAGRTTQFAWNPDGDLSGQTDPSGAVTTVTRDPAGQISDIALTSGSASLSDQGFSYDSVGDLTHRTAGASTNDFTFDPVDQVTADTITPIGGTASTSNYTVSPAGLLTVLPGSGTLAYNSNSNEQLTSLTPASGAKTTYVYDGNGDRVTATVASSPAAVTRLTYNSSQSLTGVTTSTGKQLGYTTDGDGLRQSRASTPAGGGTTTTQQLTWADFGTIPELLDDGAQRYLYGPGLTPYAQVNDTTGVVQYLHTDQVGSVTSISDSDGLVIGTTTYSLYGARTRHTGTADSAIGFTGAWTDADTGLVYLRARDYDPYAGQFTAVDPIVETTHQPYAYAGNNPLQTTDPTGLWCAVGHNADGSCRGSGALNQAVTTDFSTSLADHLQTGASGDVVSFFEGVGDGASFGLTATVRDGLSPGASCQVNQNIFYYGGYATGTAADSVIAGAAAAAAVSRISTASQLFEAAELGGSGEAYLDNDALKAASESLDRNGLTRAGRALQKHGDRSESVFPRSTGTAEMRNAQGSAEVARILDDPDRTVQVLDNVINIVSSDGSGVRYTRSGVFMGFLEP